MKNLKTIKFKLEVLYLKPKKSTFFKTHFYSPYKIGDERRHCLETLHHCGWPSGLLSISFCGRSYEVFPLRRPRLSCGFRQHEDDSRRRSRHHLAPALLGDDVIRQRLAVLVAASHLVAIDDHVHLDHTVAEAGRNFGVRGPGFSDQRLLHGHLLDAQKNSTEVRRRRFVIEANGNRK